MILDRLIALRRRLPNDETAIPEAHKRQAVRWILSVSPDGRVTGLAPAGDKKGLPLVAPYAKRTGATVPFLLVDKPDYVLGAVEEDGDSDRAAHRHEAYLALLRDAARATGDTNLEAVHRALADDEQRAAALDALNARGWKPGDLVAPSVAGSFPHEAPAVRRYWIDRQSAGATERSGLTAECLACGQVLPIARTHPVELQVGPDRVGLVTGNAAAFLSHGLQQSEIAPLCHDCARSYGEALRFLLQSPEQHLRVGDATWLFWTREPVPGFAFGRLLSDPQPADVQGLLSAARAGHLPELRANAFHALVVSANKSRLVVRDYFEAPLDRVMASLGGYFERQRVVVRGEDTPVKLFALAASTVQDATKRLSPTTTAALLQHALTGRRLPLSLLHQALLRARAEAQPVTRPRAALIRLVLLSQPNALMADAALNPDHPEPAYHCGRLLAVLDELQRKAISPNATLVDRFYGSASSTPAAVFGTLVRKAQPHVAKLRKAEGDPWLDRRIGEIAARIPAYPTTLTPEQQGLFALGFYHEKYRPFFGGAAPVDAPGTPVDA